jgi:hypothetical protein
MESMQAVVAQVMAPEAALAVDDRLARGRALASRAVDELIDELQRRAARHSLDRGVRLSFPFFDDRRLSLRWRDFTVVPRGRILFVPAFVVLAAEREIERVGQDRQYSETTRQHLIGLLTHLREAFFRQGE